MQRKIITIMLSKETTYVMRLNVNEGILKLAVETCWSDNENNFYGKQFGNMYQKKSLNPLYICQPNYFTGFWNKIMTFITALPGIGAIRQTNK